MNKYLHSVPALQLFIYSPLVGKEFLVACVYVHTRMCVTVFGGVEGKRRVNKQKSYDFVL